MTKLYALATLMALGLLSSCGSGPDEPAPATANLALDLEPVVSTAPLKLNTQAYAKADGQTFRVSQFKYLLSNVQLRKADGSTYAVPDSYYLVDAAAPASQHLVLDKVPVGDYTGLSFVVGVDAAHNNGTFQSGGVNHNNDMYWDWSTEYVFLKMAGTSPQAPTGRSLTFHVGGNPCARTVTLPFGTRVLPVKAGHVPAVHLAVNVLGLFDSALPANRVNFAVTYSVESGHPWAPVVADNYAAGMFSVAHILTN